LIGETCNKSGTDELNSSENIQVIV